MSEDLVLVAEPVPGCTVITLNRPTAKNALSRALRRDLTVAIDRLEGNEQRVLVLTGAGNVFCAGLDLKELGASDLDDAFSFDDRALDPVAALAGVKGPVIGAINGAAITGGFELALACDVLVCSRTARFADTHARVGVMPTWGLSQRLSRAIGIYRARELSLTGNFLSAELALTYGLVSRVVEPEQLLAESLALAGQMLSAVPQMLGPYKALINDGFALPLGEALALEAERGKRAALAVDMQDVERRRAEVLARNRQESHSSAPGRAPA